MNKAACYLRVSTEEQARGGVSLPDQEERTKAYCKMMGYELVAVIREEGVSAGKKLSERPGGKALISLVSTKQVNHVVAMKLDRLFRDAENALTQSNEWDKANVALHFVDMGGQTINTSSAMGKMFFTMSAAFAELERNLISERTSGALSYKKTRKEAYCPTPFGFTREGKALVAHKEELEIVERINTLRAQGVSFDKIAKAFNREGIPSKNGGRWYASTVHYIVKNSLYKEDVA